MYFNAEMSGYYFTTQELSLVPQKAEKHFSNVYSYNPAIAVG